MVNGLELFVSVAQLLGQLRVGYARIRQRQAQPQYAVRGFRKRGHESLPIGCYFPWKRYHPHRQLAVGVIAIAASIPAFKNFVERLDLVRVLQAAGLVQILNHLVPLRVHVGGNVVRDL